MTYTMPSDAEAQFLIRTADGLDYARVEPWEGGLPSAEIGAKRIGGYVVALDAGLCATDKIVADYR